MVTSQVMPSPCTHWYPIWALTLIPVAPLGIPQMLVAFVLKWDFSGYLNFLSQIWVGELSEHILLHKVQHLTE